MSNEQQRLYALTEHILELMQSHQGPISFQTWMDAALYAPKLGYYESEQVFGQSGDFTTATAMGQWLALGFAHSIQQSWLALGQPTSWTLIEQGGGSGDLMCAVLDKLGQLGVLPSQVIEVEKSEQLRRRQHTLFQEKGLNIQQVADISELASMEDVIFFSNELVDAFPVLCFTWQAGQLLQRGVDWNQQKFVWKNLSALPEKHRPLLSKTIQDTWGEGYISEFNPHLTSWQQEVSQLFQRGVVLTVDYGYSQQEYYRATRIDGTLMGHYQHHVVEDVLQLSPGVCDITAHVDFSALKQAGEDAGLLSYAYITQGAWLAQCPNVQQHLEQLAATPSVESMAQISHAKRLMLPTGMGESFKLLTQGKNISDASYLVMPTFDRLQHL